jgi:hypothetical protein
MTARQKTVCLAIAMLVAITAALITPFIVERDMARLKQMERVRRAATLRGSDNAGSPPFMRYGEPMAQPSSFYQNSPEFIQNFGVSIFIGIASP